MNLEFFDLGWVVVIYLWGEGCVLIWAGVVLPVRHKAKIKNLEVRCTKSVARQHNDSM